MSSQCSPMKRCCAVLVSGMDVCPRGQFGVNPFAIPLRSGPVQIRDVRPIRKKVMVALTSNGLPIRVPTEREKNIDLALRQENHLGDKLISGESVLIPFFCLSVLIM